VLWAAAHSSAWTSASVRSWKRSLPAGAAVRILGTGLTGATGVSFNGTAADFTIASGSLATTTVPAGATTGQIQVTTPGGTLNSNVPFQVLP
jgi:hypothetical protein